MSDFPGFEYRNKRLYIENVALDDIAQAYSTPCYVYSLTAIKTQWFAYQEAFRNFSFSLHYAVKANSNINLLHQLVEWGAGFDIVSIGELERVLLAGAGPDKIVFSGVSKRSDEISRAIHAGVHCINIESSGELEQVSSIACGMQKPARISLRVNPDVDPRTHPYISTGLKDNKFGVAIERAFSLYRRAKDDEFLRPVGISCHIGSQLTDLDPFMQAATQVLDLVDELERHDIVLEHIDLGGGLGIRYRDEQIPDISLYAQKLYPLLAGRRHRLMLEPGRSLVGNAGVLLTRVEQVKHTSEKSFALVDAGMNDLMRPSLYQAWHEIYPLRQPSTVVLKEYDVVGPVCESGDFFAKARALPELAVGEMIAIMSAGAYGMSMSSNYNSRQRPAEILVDDTETRLIRRRETLEQLWESEVFAEEAKPNVTD